MLENMTSGSKTVRVHRHTLRLTQNVTALHCQTHLKSSPELYVCHDNCNKCLCCNNSTETSSRKCLAIDLHFSGLNILNYFLTCIHTISITTVPTVDNHDEFNQCYLTLSSLQKTM